MDLNLEIANGFTVQLNEIDFCNLTFWFFDQKLIYPVKAQCLRLLGSALETHENVHVIGMYKEIVYRKYYRNQKLYSIICKYPGGNHWQSMGFTLEDWNALITFVKKHPGDPTEIDRYQTIIQGKSGFI